MNKAEMRCDGCGQLGSPEHIARRLQRLEWTTRYRPVHIGTMLLGAVSPQADSEFIYAPGGSGAGEAGLLLYAAGIKPEGRSADVTLAEFQRAGFFVTHVLECPLENGNPEAIQQLIANRLPAVLTRIRRSLKPKKLVPISSQFRQFLPVLAAGDLPCTVLLDGENPFALDGGAPQETLERLRRGLKARSVQGSDR
jgi:hypothetical protein